ncbi:MAG: dUTP diphosphatase [Bordetella sp.]|nr:MAG: dUTP diphosphatase [Bordetella sp.]
MSSLSLSPHIEIKITDLRLKKWGLPNYQSSMAAAIDLYACINEKLILKAGKPAELISSGIAIHMNNPHMMAIIAPRSGYGHKRGLVLGNSIGIIDADYSGTVYISAWNRNVLGNDICIDPGDRIAQMIFLPIIRPILNIVRHFSEINDRRENGFGSTDF